MIINRLAEINKLIAIGQCGQKAGVEIGRDFLYSLPNETKVKSLSFGNLIYLIRGVAILELDQDKYQFGSTTVVGHLLKALKLRKSEGRGQAITDLINWLLSHRKNPYIPFGIDITLSVKSINDYNEYCVVKINHQEKMEAINKLRSTKAKRNKQVNILRHQQVADKKNEERTATIKKLKRLTVKSRLRHILISDKPINYFPEEWAELDASEFEKLPKDLMEKLYLKLGQAKSGSNWCNLKKVIVSHLANDKNK